MPPPPPPHQPGAGMYGAPGPYGGGASYLGAGAGGSHLARPASYSVGGSAGPGGYGPPPPSTMHARPASYAAGVPSAYPPASNAYYQPQPPMPPPPLPPTMPQPGYLSATPSPMLGGGQPSSGFVSRPPRVASMQPGDFAALQNGMDAMSLGCATPALGGYMTGGPAGRPNYYANPEDGPPHKLAVTQPDQKMLASMRETAHAGGGDMQKKVAWAKQVLKFIERHQSSAGESSRITDPTLVRWTDEALNHILASASSPNPVPLALYLRGELSSSGSFPSYRSKDAKSSFRDFEAAANAGYVKAWFRIGRAYEDYGDIRRAVGAYEKGVEKGCCGSTYRLAMAYLLGQIGVTADVPKALGLLRRAADSADLDTPQPPYILGMLLCGEFDAPSVQLNKSLIPIDIDEAKWRVERSAYLRFGPAQYKMGYAYEYATLGCLFDPLLSVQYYALASQNGEVEADMALSKWYLCGSEGNFEKNEALALTFAEKAAARQLPAAEFALGYFAEVGLSGAVDIEKAKRWYSRAAGHGNDDAKKRLEALQLSNPETLNRNDHDANVETKLIRKRTAAKIRSDEQRECLASSKLAASLSGANLGPGSGGHIPPPVNVPLAQAQYQHGMRPPSGQQGASYPSQSLRRNHTMRQVEEAARMGPPPPGTPNPMNPMRPTPGRYPSPSPSGRQGYQLSDAPPSQRPPPQQQQQQQPIRPPPQQQQSQQQQGRPQAIPVQAAPDKHKPATFAEMGIATQKAKKDDCVIA
ncbi:hypothetical protein NBRC10513v2_003601 [Rhodotorula toruloides]|nr:hypothetical protein AAT19DRAFT_12074 [Rhodotorula toruloides]